MRRLPAARESLGRGLLGETWASTGQDGRPLALKRIRVPQLRDRASSQLTAVQRLPWHQHPALLPFVDVVFGDDALWIVSELDRGVTLRRLLTMTILTPTEAAMIIQRILEGLSALRERDLDHGDLHANNVHVSPEGEVRLGDWGLRSLAGPTRAEGRPDGAGGSDLAAAAILIRRIMANSRRWLGRRSPEAAALDEAATALPLDGDDRALRDGVTTVGERTAALLDRDTGYRAQFDIASRVRAVTGRSGAQPQPAAPGGAGYTPSAGGVRPPPSPAMIVRPTAETRTGWPRPDVHQPPPAEPAERRPAPEPEEPRPREEPVERPRSPELAEPRAPQAEAEPGPPIPAGEPRDQHLTPAAPEADPDTEPEPEAEPEPIERSWPDPAEQEAADDGPADADVSLVDEGHPDADDAHAWGAGSAPWEIREWPAPAPVEPGDREEEAAAEPEAWPDAEPERPKSREPAAPAAAGGDGDEDEDEDDAPAAVVLPAGPVAHPEEGPRKEDEQSEEDAEGLVASHPGPAGGPEARRGAGGLFMLMVGVLVLAAVVVGIVHLRGSGQPAGQGQVTPMTQTAPPRASVPAARTPAPVSQTLPTSAGTIRAVQLRPVNGTCSPGSTCTVRVDLQLVPMAAPQRLTWNFKVIDRCTGAVTNVSGIDFQSGPGWASAYGTTDVPLPAGQALAVVAVTSSPSQTASAPLLIPAQASSCQAG